MTRRPPHRCPPGNTKIPSSGGFYSDPSMVRVGEDYYLVSSTFCWFPGIPVFHSRDLVHWTQIGNAIDRPGMLNFDSLGLSRGVFAPDISWHDGTFYIVNTCVDCGGNYIITAKNPAGPWSDPVWLKDVGGIDTSLFVDQDGSAWLLNNDAPEGTPLYDGHRAIWIRKFDLATLKTSGPGACDRQWGRRHFDQAGLGRRPASLQARRTLLSDDRGGRHRDQPFRSHL